MQIIFTNRFEKDYKKLKAEGRIRMMHVLEKLPVLVGKPHLHAGVGIRKLHPSGIFEARIGLGLRLVFGLQQSKITLHRIGDHETISRYLKSL